ncbi:MAG: His/Gly/Thr/Pro-type tRNA ligase C-terminal domain-containing protein, partial [Candidatus Zixiibacteriota bacterium]
YLDSNGIEKPIIMGSYGIGITRTPQAVLEKYNDEKGIIWPKNIAPYLVELIPLNMDSEALVQASENIYKSLTDSGYEVLYDDRHERPGVKFNDADLIGIPIRITVGDKSLKQGKIEIKARKDKEIRLINIDEVMDTVKEIAKSLN